MAKDNGERNFVPFPISAVIVEPVNDELLLFGLKKFAGLCGKVDDEEPADDTYADCDGPLNDEDP